MYCDKAFQSHATRAYVHVHGCDPSGTMELSKKCPHLPDNLMLFQPLINSSLTHSVLEEAIVDFVVRREVLFQTVICDEFKAIIDASIDAGHNKALYKPLTDN